MKAKPPAGYQPKEPFGSWADSLRNPEVQANVKHAVDPVPRQLATVASPHKEEVEMTTPAKLRKLLSTHTSYPVRSLSEAKRKDADEFAKLKVYSVQEHDECMAFLGKKHPAIAEFNKLTVTRKTPKAIFLSYPFSTEGEDEGDGKVRAEKPAKGKKANPEPEPEAAEDDLAYDDTMAIGQLKAVAAMRGVTVPKKASKVGS